MRTLQAKCMVWLLVFTSVGSMAQNASRFQIKEESAESVTIERACQPSDLIIFISSPLDGLTFESNLIKPEELVVIQHAERDEYAICHSMERLILTVKKDGYEPFDIKIDGMRSRYKYTISGDLVKGTLSFSSKPQKANVAIEKMTVFPTPMMQELPSGQYKAKLSKDKYVTKDTSITFPIDGFKEFYFELERDFPTLKFDIQSTDSLEFKRPPVLWIDSDSVVLDGLVNKSKKPASYDDGVKWCVVYENNEIPVQEGYHHIKIQAPGFDTFELSDVLKFENSKTTPFKARLLPNFGYLVVVDDENNEGADVYLDGKLIGKAPLEYKARIGKYKVSLVKKGFLTLEESYEADITKDGTCELPIPMYISKQICFISKPTRAKVSLEGTSDDLIGHTPFKKIFEEGDFWLRFEKSGGYASERYKLTIDETRKDNDTVILIFKKGEPVSIISETVGLDLEIQGLDSVQNIATGSNLKTPTATPLNIPYGKYSVVLKEASIKRYKGIIKHNPYHNGIVKLPCYSNKSFKPITADFINKNNFEASFGQSYFIGFSGLSTAILNVQFFSKEVSQVNDLGETELTKINMLIPNIILLNWDWRIGGSILRNLDICALGRIKYTPGLKLADWNIKGLNDATMFTGFYGMELSTRFSYFNLNCKAGVQHLQGTTFAYDNTLRKYETTGTAIKERIPMVSVGMTLNGAVDRSNNVLRLWHHPPVNLSSIFNYVKTRLSQQKGKSKK